MNLRFEICRSVRPPANGPGQSGSEQPRERAAEAGNRAAAPEGLPVERFAVYDPVLARVRSTRTIEVS
jgi:hypothetical protein